MSHLSPFSSPQTLAHLNDAVTLFQYLFSLCSASIIFEGLLIRTNNAWTRTESSLPYKLVNLQPPWIKVQSKLTENLGEN